jgi:signal peptidase II
MARTGDVALAEQRPALASAQVGLRIAIAIVVAAADQISKSVVLARHAGVGSRPRGWFSVQLVRNHGASTGIGASHPLVVTAVELLGIACVAAVAVRARKQVVGVAVALVLGGALGNVADRFVRAPGLGRGAVVDWIHLGWRDGSLDLADVAIQLGAVFALVAVLVSGWVDSRQRRRSSDRPASMRDR